MRAAATRRLWDLDAGEAAEVDRVPDDAAEALRYLADSGIRPGAPVEVIGRGPLDGPLFVRAGGSDEVALSRELAEAVWFS